MSREFLKDDAGVPDSGGEHYDSGRVTPEEMIARALVGEFNEMDKISEKKYVLRALDNLFGEILPSPQMDSQEIIERVVDDIRSADSRHLHYSESLFTSLMTTLFDKGYNDFRLDLRGYTHVGRHIGFGLEGIEEQALRVQYLLPAHNLALIEDQYSCSTVGMSTKYCEMHIEGRAKTVAGSSIHSFYFLNQPPYGLSPKKDCSFFFDETELIWISGPTIYEEYDYSFATPDGEALVHTPKNFLPKNNSLYVPDGSGGWQEVRVE